MGFPPCASSETTGHALLSGGAALQTSSKKATDVVTGANGAPAATGLDPMVPGFNFPPASGGGGGAVAPGFPAAPSGALPPGTAPSGLGFPPR